MRADDRGETWGAGCCRPATSRWMATSYLLIKSGRRKYSGIIIHFKKIIIVRMWRHLYNCCPVITARVTRVIIITIVIKEENYFLSKKKSSASRQGRGELSICFFFVESMKSSGAVIDAYQVVTYRATSSFSQESRRIDWVGQAHRGWRPGTG